jgi:uncharacterized protein
MTLLSFVLIMLLASFAAGMLGALTGLGGGVILVPVLTLFFKVDIHYAIGTSLVAVTAAYVKEGYTNMRIGIFMEIATTIGALLGTLLILHVANNAIAITFGCILIFTAILTIIKRNHDYHQSIVNSPIANALKLNGNYPYQNGLKEYHVANVGAGFLIMSVAGLLSSLLGIGSGAFKVLAMDNVMKLPFKVSTTTSNFMIGVTAAASSVLYFHRGYIDPILTLPVVIGVFGGAMVGARILIGSGVRILKIIFSIAVSIIAVQMIRNGLKGLI